MEISQALKIASRVQQELAPYCEQIVIAGSIRREKPDVHDIELVARPRMTPSFDLWGEKVGEHSLLNDRGLFERFGVVTKAGPRFVQVDLFDGIMLDLFVVLPPAQWGVILAIRTGPADFSKWLVTPRSKGGAMYNGCQVEDGRVWDGRVTFDMQDERKLLAWLELGWIEPKDRTAQWGRFPRSYNR